MHQEVDEQKQLDKALRDSEERFRQLAENIDEVLWLTDWKNKELLYVNPSYEKIFGQSCQSLYEDRLSWTKHIHKDDKKRIAKAFAKDARTGRNTEQKYRLVLPNGKIRWIRDRAFPVRDESGQVYRIVGVAEDITDSTIAYKKLHEKSQMERLLFKELDHRIRNNLTSLITLVKLTEHSSTSVGELAVSIINRIQAMANVHNLLSQSRWQLITLRQLLEIMTPPNRTGAIIVKGEEVLISHRQTTGIGAVFSELMINSTKYGALKTDQGRINISWSITQSSDSSQQISLDWSESHGPEVKGDPTPHLGSQIIEGIVKTELGGQVQFAYPPEGAQHRFILVLDTADKSIEEQNSMMPLFASNSADQALPGT